MDIYRGKVVVITGGASGIGRALGEHLARLGARVWLADRDLEGGEAAAEQLRRAGAEVRAAAVDVTDARAVQGLADQVTGTHGAIDYFFNNAGMVTIGEVRDLSLDDWYQILDVNIRGVVHGIAAVYPAMIERGSGHIVNTASVAGLVPVPGIAPYVATKHAVVGLSLSLRPEAARYGVRVSVVCPGVVQTNIMENATQRKMDSSEVMAKMKLKAYPVESCARDIARGVAKNEAQILVTHQAKVLSRLYRAIPGVLQWASERRVRKSTLRKES